MTKKRLIYATLAAVLLCVAYWCFNHSFIEVVVDNPTAGNLSYSLLSQKGNSATEITSEASSVKRLVSRGNYEVFVKQSTVSQFTVTKSGRFLGTTTIHATLQPEKERKFVGDKPNACMYYAGQILLSYGCSDSYDKLQLHMPATASQPTIVRRVPSTLDGTIEGIAKTAEGDVVLLHDSSHTVYLLQNNGSLSGGVILPDLDEGISYVLRAYKDGFIAYDTSFNDVWYYTSRTAKPTKINLEKPADSTLSAYALSVNGSSIMAAYSSATDSNLDLDNPKTAAKIKSEFITTSGGQTSRVALKGYYPIVTLCGTSKLCLVSDKKLGVYDGSDSKLLFAVAGVTDIQNTPGGFLVIRDKDVLGLNVDNGTGSSQFSFGEYSYCGLQASEKNYVLCLTNSKGNKVALYINQAANDTDSIDKKVAALLKLSEIKNISSYGKYLFISPELGELVKNPNAAGFDYDPSVKQAVQTKINQEIDKLKIDRNTYKIADTLE